MLDYLIIGQGLAGTWLSHFLLQKNKSVLLIDDAHPLSASRVSSGLMNPITGRKLVKSWKAETLFPFARKNYRQLEERLQTRFCYDRTMIWLLSNVQELNTFWTKSGEVGYEKYFKNIQNQAFHPAFKNKVGFGEISGAMFVNTLHLLQSYRQYLQQSAALIEGKFEYKDLVLKEKSVVWKGIEARRIIFCEGHQARFNPYFNWLPFVPAKGECLIIEAKGLDLEQSKQIVKNKISILPLGNDRYWVGSTYEWKELNEISTSKARYKNSPHNSTIRFKFPTKSLYIKQVFALPPKTAVLFWDFIHITPISVFSTDLGTKGVSLSSVLCPSFCSLFGGRGGIAGGGGYSEVLDFG